MQYIIEGVLLGLTLTILLGPIFIALTHTGIKHGIRAGLSVGSGIWLSDILVILASYFFIVRINALTANPAFHYWMGISGGIILIVFGLFSFFKSHKGEEKTRAFNAKSYLGYFTKGFIVNFINPFTFVFWIGVMTTYVVSKGIGSFQVFLLFGSIMLTIITTDSIKVILAKMIREKMKTYHLTLFGKIAGALLVLFGLLLLLRTNVI